MPPPVLSLTQKYRMVIGRGIVALVFFVLLFSSHSWEQNHFIDGFCEIVGLLLIAVCTFGRLWSSLYVSGYKDVLVVDVGPYSVVRNPLYVFSFIGTAGIGLASENILILLLAPLLFVFYYPFVVRAEEKYLLTRFGDAFRQYMERVPRFIPDFSLYKEPETYNVNIGVFKRAMFDATMFFWIYIAMAIIEKLHYAAILPVLFRIP